MALLPIRTLPVVTSYYMISYHTFLQLDHEQRIACLQRYGRFVVAGPGALAVEAYFTISDFFVHVVLDQDEMTVVYVRPMRSGSGMEKLIFLLDGGPAEHQDLEMMAWSAWFQGWCLPPGQQALN